MWQLHRAMKGHERARQRASRTLKLSLQAAKKESEGQQVGDCVATKVAQETGCDISAIPIWRRSAHATQGMNIRVESLGALDRVHAPV